MNAPRFNTLEQALATVPRSLQPPRDLWPEIAQELGLGTNPASSRTPRGARPQWPMALVASLVVLSLVGALCWSVVRERATAELLAQRAAAGQAGHRLVSFQPPQDTDYVAARAALERTFYERLELLAPTTRDRVRADLDTIRKANADIRAALAQDPASPLLWQLLRSTWQHEIDLYTTIAQTTQPMLTRKT